LFRVSGIPTAAHRLPVTSETAIITTRVTAIHDIQQPSSEEALAVEEELLLHDRLSPHQPDTVTTLPTIRGSDFNPLSSVPSPFFRRFGLHARGKT